MLLFSLGTRSNATATTDLQCSDGFYFNDKRCQPECGEWEEWSSSTVEFIDVIVILAASIDVIVSAVTIVTSVVQHKRM